MGDDRGAGRSEAWVGINDRMKKMQKDQGHGLRWTMREMQKDKKHGLRWEMREL